MKIIIVVDEIIRAIHFGTIQIFSERIDCLVDNNVMFQISKNDDSSVLFYNVANSDYGDVNIFGKRLNRSGDTNDEIDLRYYKVVNDDYLFDIELVKQVHNQGLKETVRKVFAKNPAIGDAGDQLADIDKRVDLIIPVVLRLFLHVFDEEEIPQEIRQGYIQFARTFIQAIDSGAYRDRVDLENPAVLIPKLMGQRNEVANIIETEYLSKKMN